MARASYDPIGGMQNHTGTLTRELDARGVRQTVVTSRLGGPTGRVRLGRCTEVVRVGLPTRRFRQCWAPAALRHVLAAGPDLVHVHQGEDVAALPLGLAAARRAGCPLVVTLHTSVAVSVPRTGLRLSALHTVGAPVERLAVRHADAVIALTRTTSDRLSRDDVVVIPSGVEPGAYPAPESALLAGLPRPRVGYVGRLATQKDVPTLVRAFGRMRTPATLCLVGDGPERPAVERAVAALPSDVRARVHAVGFRPHDEVAGLLAGVDVMVLPSVYEEMGSVLVEAMRAGVPVVASRVGGIPDVVVDGVTGVLVPPRDDVAFAAALDDLLTDPGRRAAMTAAALDRAADYAWPRLAERVLGVYRAALAARSCTPANNAAVRSIV